MHKTLFKTLINCFKIGQIHLTKNPKMLTSRKLHPPKKIEVHHFRIVNREITFNRSQCFSQCKDPKLFQYMWNKVLFGWEHMLVALNHAFHCMWSWFQQASDEGWQMVEASSMCEWHVGRGPILGEYSNKRPS